MCSYKYLIKETSFFYIFFLIFKKMMFSTFELKDLNLSLQQ